MACPDCHGTGRDLRLFVCPRCYGQGSVCDVCGMISMNCVCACADQQDANDSAATSRTE